MKLRKNDQSNKSSISVEILSSEVICPCPRATNMYKIMKKIYVKSEFKAVLLKLTANVQSNDSFLR